MKEKINKQTATEIWNDFVETTFRQVEALQRQTEQNLSWTQKMVYDEAMQLLEPYRKHVSRVMTEGMKPILSIIDKQAADIAELKRNSCKCKTETNE